MFDLKVNRYVILPTSCRSCLRPPRLRGIGRLGLCLQRRVPVLVLKFNSSERETI